MYGSFKKSHIRRISVLSVGLLLFWSLSCGRGISSETQIVSGDTEVFRSETPAADGGKNEEIIDAVNQFWKLSLDGDQNGLAKYMHEAPPEFWTVCPATEDADNSRNVGNSAYNGTLPPGHGVGISRTEEEDSFWLLKNFSEQISKAKPVLLKSRIIRSNENEAEVKIDWVSQRDKDKAGWISLDLLLYKDAVGWKAFMLTNSSTLKRYNKIFGTTDACN